MIIFTLILALGFRLMSLNQYLWLDEATSALTTKMNLADFFGKFMPGDFHPPLYYLTLRVWAAFFGTSELAFRSLSVLFGIATIYLVYKLGGKIAALLLATSGLHIYYSQETRMYSMSTFLVTLAMFSFVKILNKKARGLWWGIFALVLGLIGLTDYLPLLILIPIWVFVIISKKDKKWLTKFVVSHIILLIFALLWGPTFFKQLTAGVNVTTTSPSWVNVLGKFSIKDVLLIPVKFVIGRVGFDNKYLYSIIVGISLLLYGFIAVKSRKLLFWLWLLIPVGLALVISIKLPVLNYFRFLFVLPAFYLIIANGLENINKKWRWLFLTLVVGINQLSSLIYLTNQKIQRENWRGAVNFIQSNQTQNSVVIFPADSQMEVYRYYAPKAQIYGPGAIGKGYSVIWLIRYAQPISDPEDTTRAKIEDLNYKKLNEFDFNGVVVWKYQKI